MSSLVGKNTNFTNKLKDLCSSGPGFVVLKQWASYKCDEALATYKGLAASPIFNTPTKNDAKRAQATLMKRPKPGKKAKQLYPTEWLECVLNKVAQQSKRVVGGVVMLRSTAGCSRQMAHCDYVPYDDLLNASDDTLPHLLLLALENNTFLDVWPHSHKLFRAQSPSCNPEKKFAVQQVVLDKGDALLFRADLVHAGSAYDTCNTRVHIYLDTHVKRVENRTWIVCKHAPEELASLIQEETPTQLQQDNEPT